MARLPRPVTMMISSSPEATASSTTYWIVGLSTTGSISLGWAFVAGRNRVPSPAAGKTPLRTFIQRSSGDAARGPVLALERLFDPSPKLDLGIEATGWIDSDRQP